MKFFGLRNLVMSVLGGCFFAHANSDNALLNDSQQEILNNELEWLNAESYNTTAYKFKDYTKKSPGSITVVTAQEIKNMGARDIMDVLDTIPGISVYRGAYNTRIQVRGVLRPSSEDVLMMIDGLPVTNHYIGSGVWVYNSMSMDMVKRIEIVRGPASSLYGANAFSAIINVITKDAADVDGVSLIQKTGSDGMRKSTLLFGKIFDNGLEISGFADFLETDGFSGVVERDQQTLLDEAVLSNASLAPGYSNNMERKLHLGLKLKYEGFFANMGWVDRMRGPNVGFYDALNNNSRLEQLDGYLNLGYEAELTKNLTLTPNFYYHYNNMYNRIQYLPEGAVWPYGATGPVLLPGGIDALYDVDNERFGTEWRVDWALSEDYRLVFGLNYEEMRQTDAQKDANVLFASWPFVVPTPSGEFENMTGDERFVDNVDRTFKALFLENIYDVNSDLRLTLGGRYDHYSDFGSSFNPRTSLIWDFVDDYTLKLLYARAFRAPSFYELTNEEPFVMGNRNLDPEVIDSYEVALNAQVTKKLELQLTAFHNEIKDNIVKEADGFRLQFVNTDKIIVNGVEFEANYKLDRGSYLTFNYTYQDSYDKGGDSDGSGARVGKVPMHSAYLAANLRVNSYASWFNSANFYSAPNVRWEDEGGQFGKSFGESNWVFNTGVTIKHFCSCLENAEMRFFVYNLFDNDYYSDYSTEVPYGAPMPGRTYMFELSYHF